MKKHVLALVLVGLVCLPSKQSNADCHPSLVAMGGMVVTIVSMSVMALYWARTENDRANIKGYACPVGNQHTWHCCSRNERNQIICGDMTVPCPENTFGMCHNYDYWGRERWYYTSNIYTNAAAERIAGLTAGTILMAVATVGLGLAAGFCCI